MSNGSHGVSVCCGSKRPIISLKNCIQCSGWFWSLKVNTIRFNTLILSYSLLKSHVDFRLFIFLCLMFLSSVYNANLFHIHLIPPSVIYKSKETYFTSFSSTFMFFLRQFKTTLKRMYFVRCLKDLNECLFNKMPIIYFLSCSLFSHCCSEIEHTEDFTWPNCTLIEFSILV